MRYMLDTDIASYLIKGGSPKIETRLAMLSPSQVCISCISSAELLYGLKRLPAGHRLHIAVQQFLKIVQVFPWDLSCAQWYADIRDQLTRGGIGIGEMDMMIAAHTLATGTILVTNNQRHFARIAAPLNIENWV
jgi:tRNA(fMet)-specific endonuclease VapC